MLVINCMTHHNVNYYGVEAMVENWFSTCVNINWSDYLQNGAQ